MWRKFIGCGLFFLISACQVYQPGYLSSRPPPWKYSDLRYLYPVDNRIASQQIIALYTRMVGEDAEIRLDYLDYPIDVDHDLHVYIDTKQSITNLSDSTQLNWDFLIDLPAQSGASIHNRSPSSRPSGARLRIWRDPDQDEVVITFRAAALSQHFDSAKLWIELIPVHPEQHAIKLPPIAWLGTPPERSQVILAFWNTYPSSTPSQALKSWDGAHTGPDSARHGLRHLLDAVEETNLPVILLDLKQPSWLAALEYAGNLDRVRTLAERGLIILPDVVPIESPDIARTIPPEWVFNEALDLSIRSANNFELKPSPFLYAPASISHYTDQYQVNFATGLPGLSDTPSIDAAGLTTSAIIDLVRASYSNPGVPLILGGNLTKSYWGEPFSAQQALKYIANHPWIAVLDANGLQALPIRRIGSTPHDSEVQPIILPTISNNSPAAELNFAELQAAVITELETASPGLARDLAFNMYLSLLSPAPQALHDLRFGYLGQVGHLLAASRWEENPQPLNDCSTDVDWDGKPECQLASTNFYATFEMEGAGITFAFARAGEKFVQVLGPTYQFAVGLSDPSEWDISLGLNGDPAQIIAFTEKQTRAQFTHPTVRPGEISFSDDEASVVKTYTLTKEGMSIRVDTPGFHNVTVPLVLDDLRQPEANWATTLIDSQSQDNQSWECITRSGASLSLETSARIFAAPFFASHPWLSLPENPNQDYPAGHYTLIPMNLLRIESQGPFTVQITVR